MDNNSRNKEANEKVQFTYNSRHQNTIMWMGTTKLYLILTFLYFGILIGAGYATWGVEEYLYGDILDSLGVLIFVVLSTSGTLIVISGIFCSEYS